LKSIALFGAGKSASVLIQYLLQNAEQENWHITIVDADKKIVEEKTKGHKKATAVAANITTDIVVDKIIENADVVISLMPPSLHLSIAKKCIEFSKHLLTASYVDDEIKKLADAAKQKDILFLCEMGLDPGIDHMSAMEIVDKLHKQNAVITSFKSHCGGLVAPESDNNPWHYKISWNPKNVVLAGKAGALFLKDGKEEKTPYELLFNANNTASIKHSAFNADLSYYPNRNSLPYRDLYNLQSTHTFVRTTLRYKAFMEGWKTIIDTKLTDEIPAYQSDDMSLAEFFNAHFEKHNIDFKFSQADLERLNYLGWSDTSTIILKGEISAAEGLQVALEKKLLLAPNDKDMVVMQHEFEYELNGVKKQLISSLVVKGEDNVHTAMAKTVGLPLGIAAKLILKEKIKLSGLQIPTVAAIYEPVQAELASLGVRFEEMLVG
jgi:saccharopine dehydrogenase-like NADP-dependent oxidoreductase